VGVTNPILAILHSLIKDLKLCVRSYLLLQSLLRLSAWLLVKKPQKALVKLQKA